MALTAAGVVPVTTPPAPTFRALAGMSPKAIAKPIGGVASNWIARTPSALR
jgi:hypothetical protein